MTASQLMTYNYPEVTSTHVLRGSFLQHWHTYGICFKVSVTPIKHETIKQFQKYSYKNISSKIYHNSFKAFQYLHKLSQATVQGLVMSLANAGVSQRSQAQPEGHVHQRGADEINAELCVTKATQHSSCYRYLLQ